MKKILACAAVALGLLPFGVQAGERVPDAGLGALAGGVAFGLPGVVAGGLVGYTKGPDISRALGVSGHRYHRYRRSRR
ncbi:MAG: hypothetical protein ACLPWS_15175 [Rhodomicrobium sp.]